MQLPIEFKSNINSINTQDKSFPLIQKLLSSIQSKVLWQLVGAAALKYCLRFPILPQPRPLNFLRRYSSKHCKTNP